MRRNGHKTTSGVKFDPKFDFSLPDFLYGEKFWKLDHDFMYLWQIFCGACAETARIPLLVKFLTHNLKHPLAVSYSTTKANSSLQRHPGIYACENEGTHQCHCRHSHMRNVSCHLRRGPTVRISGCRLSPRSADDSGDSSTLIAITRASEQAVSSTCDTVVLRSVVQFAKSLPEEWR